MSDDAPPAEKPTLFKPFVSFGEFYEFVAFLSLSGTWLGSLGRHHWTLDLLSHFRLQYMVVCMLVLLFALIRRRTWMVHVALLSLLWNAQIVHAFHQTIEKAETKAGRRLGVMTFNVMTGNENRVATIEHVLKADADIVCLLEVDESWRLSLEPLHVKYPHRVEEMNDGNFGIACYTRLPLKSSEVRRFSAHSLPTVLLSLDHLGVPLTFIGTHSIPPVGGFNAQVWREQLTQLGEIAASIAGEVIVAGDFNATPWCEGMRLLCERSGLQFRCVDPVWPPTWGLKLPMMIPIDHVLVKGGLSVQKRVIGPEMGSDHRSVTVEIVR